MNALETLAGLDWWFVAGWTMLHYLWLGAAVGLAAGLSRVALRRTTPQVRYGVALVWLVVLALLPAGVAVWVGAKPQAVRVAVPSGALVAGGGVVDLAKPQAVGRAVLEGVEAGAELGLVSSPVSEKDIVDLATASDVRGGVADAGANHRQSSGLTDVVEMLAGYLPWVWILGAPVTFVLLATGVVGAERLRRESRLVVDGPIAECCARLAESLRVGRQVTIAVCERVAAPVLVGIVRPMILLPPAALTGWSPEEIEMVLLHELAHVRRWDNLVNLAQRTIESLLFFHPAIWLVSNWVRREREACCDAVVVGRTNRPHAYAELLVALAAQLPRSVLFHPAASSAMAAGPLRGRIRRILGVDDDPMLISGKSLSAVMGGLLLAATLVVLNLPTLSKAKETTDETSRSPVGAAESLDKYRQVVVGYDLDFDSVFPDRPWTTYEAKRLLRYPTPQAWPDVLGHVDADASEFHEIRERPAGKFQKVTGGNAFLAPLDWSVGTENYATLLFLKGIEADAHVVAHSYSSFASFGTMAGDVLFKSYATALVDGDLTGQITADSYFNLVVTGKFTGRIYAGTYAMVYLMGGLDGEMELNRSKVYIAGSTQRSALRQIKGPGKVYLQESDLPAGEHQIGELAVTVKSHTEKFTAAAKAATKDLFLQKVPFVVGASKFAEGDQITIRAIHGTADTFKPGNRYSIEGTYTLGSRDKASLSAYTTARNAAEGTSSTQSEQIVTIERGSGEFELQLPMSVDGWPHVSFYPAGGGDGFGGTYFGTGDSVLKEWWDEKDRTTESMESPREKATAKANGGWLRDPNFVFPRDQEVARKAHRMLGLKLVPAVMSELSDVYDVGYRGALKELTVRIDAIKDKPTFLVAIDQEEVGGFDTLDEMLAKIHATKKREVWATFLVGSAALRKRIDVKPIEGGEQTVRDALRSSRPTTLTAPAPPMTPEAWAKVSGKQRTTETAADGTSAKGKFPTLEEQKLADLGWKKLGVELEKIGAEDEKRVQALGYAGGVKVVELMDRQLGQPMLAGDILVGLHVWPTRSLQDVATVLSRADLAELSPLKFYAVRQEKSRGLGPSRVKDIVATGRISVNADRRRGPFPSNPFAPRAGSAAEPAIAPEAAAAATPAAEAAPAAEPSANYQYTVVPDLRYDGKSFDQWQAAWKTELSTEKRLETVKALAAFGANGYGKEAAAAIVEVAGQYDWTSIGSKQTVDELKWACLKALGYGSRSETAHRIPEADVLPAVLTAAESQNTRSRLFAIWILPQLAATHQAAEDVLRKLSSDTDARVRSHAFRAVNIDPHPDLRSGITREVVEQLLSNDSNTVRSAVRSLVHEGEWFNERGSEVEKGPALTFTPELLPLLFAPDASVRQETRQAIRFAQGSTAAKVVEPLYSILVDEARQSDYLETIRALAAMGPKAEPAIDRLKELLSSDDPQIRIAAAAGIKMIVGKDQYQKPVADVLGEELGITVAESNGVWGALPREDVKDNGKAFADFTEAVIREQEQLFPDGKF